ncbi:MAG TPA: extracellular solute-binding protein [Clostridiales bacterium]|nr:extracellular solute-binding protein [Clostridiales bacterium]
MATLKDVAKDAGVSIATVSCCLSGSKTVKPETKMRVMDSIEKLKYIPNASARNLKSSSSNRIGVVLTDIDNLYHAEIFKGISSFLQDKSYTVSVAFSNNSPDIECERIDDFISQNVSGLIIITCQPNNTDFFKNRIKNYNIPTVFIERCPDDIFVSFISFDNYQTTYYITYELLRKGYRKIALITGSEHFSSERECISGYKDAFTNHNMAYDDNMVGNTNMSKEGAFKYTMTSIDTKNIEAVITTSQNIAEGVLEAFHIKGLKVPENVQLITFSEECWNTTAKIPGVVHSSRTAFTLGTAASNLLLRNIKSPLLFEEETITFSDDIINYPLDVPMVDALKPPKDNVQVNPSGLRVLMVDLATSHSTMLLSSNFTRRTGIPISFDFVPQNKVLKTIQDMISSKDAYDIYMYDVPWLEYMVQNSFVSDISEFVDSNDFNKDLLFKENMDNCRCEDKFYGVPIIGGSQIMFYRKDLFENREIIKTFKNKYKISLRPPKTWTEFNGTAEFFTRSYNPKSPTEYGTSFAGIIDEELAPEILIRLWSYGGKIWDKYNRACLNSPENAKAFHSILRTVKYTGQSPFEVSIQQTVSDFCHGKTAMLITYTEYAAQISESIHKKIIGRVGYEPLPGKTPVSIGWNFGLNPFSTKTEMAYLYFNWLCKHDTSYYMTILDGQSPVIAPYHSHELLKLYPWMEITEKSFEYARKRNGPYRSKALVIPQNKIETILCNVLRLILTQGLSIQAALDIGQKQMVTLFNYYGYPKPLHFI